MASSGSSSGAPGAHLRDGELRLRLALEAAYVIAFEWDIPRDEVRRLYSTDLTLGPTADDAPVSFATVCQVVHPDDRELFVARVQAAFAHPDGRYEAEYRL
ncbi:MAG: hypothetical protein IT181_15665, partial [Acidobacteria bacterium]|nr:hypothetical protein [Acidobacteriota bacterium]